MNHGFLPGDELVESHSGRVLYVVEALLPRIHSIKVLDIVHKAECVLEEAPLRPQIASGELRILRKGTDWSSGLHRRSDADDEPQQAAMRVLEAVKQLMKRHSVSFNRAYAMLVEDVRAEGGAGVPSFPSRAHAYRLRKRELDGIPLHLGDSMKGNRTPRYESAVVEVVKHLAQQQFLQTHSRWTLQSLTELVNSQLHDAGLLLADKRVSRLFVQRVIHDQVHSDPEHRRMHPQDAIAAKAVARRKIRIAGLFERVEQDALHLPWLIRTPYGDSTNVYLVHAIDCGPSIPLGWCLVIGAPNTPATLKCIETILFPKARQLEQLGLKYDFDIYGTPSLLVLDNGPENKSERLLRLTRLGIDINRVKARHAHHKPFIERLNRSLKSFLETLPGCTRMDGKDGQRNPAALGDPVMTLAEMERWIVRFYFEHWVHKPLERLTDSIFVDNEDLGSTPLQRYETLTEKLGYPVPLPPSLEAWRSAVYEQEYRMLSRKTGISYGNYHFRGDRLSQLISQFGETEVKVLIDRDDFRVVYVVDRDGRTLIPLVNSSTSDATPAYSFDVANGMLKAHAETEKSFISEALRRDVFNRSVGVKPKAQGSSKKGAAGGKAVDTSRETAKRAREHQAVIRAGQKPLPPQGPSLGHPPLGTDEDDWSNVAALDVLDRKTGEARS